MGSADNKSAFEVLVEQDEDGEDGTMGRSQLLCWSVRWLVVLVVVMGEEGTTFWTTTGGEMALGALVSRAPGTTFANSDRGSVGALPSKGKMRLSR